MNAEPCQSGDLERVLSRLDAEEPAAAAYLRRAWLRDLLARGAPPTDVAASAGVPVDELESWLRRRTRSAETGSASQETLTDVSVIVPVHNEEENLPELYRRLCAALSTAGSHEILFVDDGSSDGSVGLIRQMRAEDPAVRLLILSRNFGHQAAVTAGIDHCRGRAVVILDADLQDPPELLTEMLARWREGAEVVYGVRLDRKEGLLKRASYYCYYRLLRFASHVEIPLDSGDFCLMDRKVVEHLRRLPERNRFLRGLRSWLGYRQVALPYERQARHAGTPKYTFAKLVKLALDGLVSFSSLPLRAAAYLGLFTCGAGIVYLSYALVHRAMVGTAPQGWTSLVALVLIIGGAQLVVLGVLGEYVARIYDESKQRPAYIVREIHG
jgi:polyisoprenyl-phosphate glycosyltransferase